MKKIGKSDFIGQRGIVHTDGVAHSKGFVFYSAAMSASPICIPLAAARLYNEQPAVSRW